jgi:hypothetical protein
MVRQILNAGRQIPLRRLFMLREYPRDVGALYAEGFSVSNFLVSSSDRPTFLKFVGHGMQFGWDSAAQTHYRYQSVDQLEEAWLMHLRNTRNQPTQLAHATTPMQTDPAKRVIVRLTAPPVQPLDDPRRPIVRAQAPETELNSGWTDSPRQPFVNRPGYLPEYNPNPHSAQPQPVADAWQSPGVRLQAPQFNAPAPQAWNNPGMGSPVGYPR